ncbi:hypothetical protein [uncultured Bacteroides sp.]|uniref:hypothetical protein n=1 Tax=uncultured Bacteroides sp. TaxID=162156 RepID=UPI002AA9627F|nr:hypothetical protein [uncultured Bacteroides sp.]
MKKRSLFLVVIGTLLLSVCDYDKVAQDKVPATLKLTITGTDVDTRSFVTPGPVQTEEKIDVLDWEPTVPQDAEF